MQRLINHVAVVTGAGSGIGKAIATALASEGACVCLVGRTREKLEATARTLQGAHAIFAVDLSQDSQITSLANDLEREYGRVDILVLCAGEYAHGSIEQSSVEVFDRLYRANVRGNYLLIQSLLPALRRQPGQIVVINSSAGLSARPNGGQFSATQHALRAVTEALRGEVNSLGIRVLSVYPGRTATPRIESLYQQSAHEYKPELLLQPQDVASVVLNALTLPRTAEVTDISIRPMLKSY